jgi:hypothetical protein
LIDRSDRSRAVLLCSRPFQLSQKVAPKSPRIQILEGPVEMKPVENLPCFSAARLRFCEHFIGCARGSSVKIGDREHCGKLVKTMWTRHNEFG